MLDRSASPPASSAIATIASRSRATAAGSTRGCDAKAWGVKPSVRQRIFSCVRTSGAALPKVRSMPPPAGYSPSATVR